MRRRKSRLLKYFTALVALAAGIAFVAKFAGPNILKQYLIYGIGNCKDIPILCDIREDKNEEMQANPDYAGELVQYSFPQMSISCPKGFSIVQELIKKPYYKNRKYLDRGAIIYLLYQAPGSFINLYPQVKKYGIRDNYAFIDALQHARLDKIKTLNDAFFLIMKSIWIPDLGNQNIVRTLPFRVGDKRGFINYNLSKPDNYFDCNVLDAQDNYFKVYIKDKGARLDLNRVCTIISTIRP